MVGAVVAAKWAGSGRGAQNDEASGEFLKLGSMVDSLLAVWTL